MGMATIGEFNDDDDWYYMDLRKQCLRWEVHNFTSREDVSHKISVFSSSLDIPRFPKKFANKAIGMTNGRVVACGGEDEEGAYTNECYDYTPSDGWTQIGNYPKILWETDWWQFSSNNDRSNKMKQWFWVCSNYLESNLQIMDDVNHHRWGNFWRETLHRWWF